MKLFILFALLLVGLMLIVLAWGAYETVRAARDGRWRPITTVALLASGLVLLLMLYAQGDIDYLWEIPDAFACSDNEIIIEAISGEAAGGLGSVEGWDFGGCTAYWYR